MIALDIETIPIRELESTLEDPEVALGNLKDPKKIEEKKLAARQAQLDKMALSPFTGRICAYSTWSNDMALCGYEVIDEVSDAAEISIVQKILRLFTIGANSYPAIMTWNGYAFDIPFIFKRAMLLRVQTPLGMLGMSRFTRRYSIAPHMDLERELTGWGHDYLSLEEAATSILGEHKTAGIDFKQFIPQIESGRGAEIGLYCMRDSELTYRIYERVAPYIF